LIAQFTRSAGAGRVALGASCINIKNWPLFWPLFGIALVVC